MKRSKREPKPKLKPEASCIRDMTTPAKTTDGNAADRGAHEAGTHDVGANEGATPERGAPERGPRDRGVPIGVERGAGARYAGIRNALMGVGVFYVTRWLTALIHATLTPLVHAVMSADGVRPALLTPFVTSLSQAIAAASAGAVVVLLADAPATSTRWRWAAVPAVLWFVRSLDDVTISAPGWIHLVSQLVAASLPSIVCLAAGHLADWHRSR